MREVTALHSTAETEGEYYFRETLISSEDTRLLASVFVEMALDPYCKGGFRYRALNRYWVEENRLVPRPHELFTQSAEINFLWGGMNRNFPELPIPIAIFPTLSKVALEFLSQCNCDPGNIELQVHPIRTVCAADKSAEPAPEGFHTDGYMYSSIYVVRRDEDLAGGCTFLRTGRQDGRILFERTLPVGTMLAFDDTRMFHYTAPIRKTCEGIGMRDVLVFTVSPREGKLDGRSFTR